MRCFSRSVIQSGGNVLHPLIHDRLRQYGCRGRPVAGSLRRLRGHLPRHLRTQILEPVLQFDFLGHDHSGIDHRGRPKTALKHDEATLWPESYLDGAGKQIETSTNLFARLSMEFQYFRGHDSSPQSRAAAKCIYPKR